MLIENTPDTVVTLRDGTKLIVKETPEFIVESQHTENKKWTELR